MERYGLPKPDHGCSRRTRRSPTTSSRASRTARSRRSRTSRELTERTVRFADGSEVEADVVVYCTGYKVTFPFFDAGLIAAPDNDLPLFRRVFHPDIGERLLHRPAAAARRDHAARRGCSPSGSATTSPAATRCRRARELRADIEAERAAMFKRYVASKRHTMQVDFDDYVLALARSAGAARARRAAGHRLPVPPRAGGRRRDGRGRAARAHEGGQPRGDPRGGARRVRRARLRRRPACATSCAAPSSPRARSTTTSPTRTRSSARVVEDGRRRGAPARAGRARERAATAARVRRGAASARTSSSSSRIRRTFALPAPQPRTLARRARRRALPLGAGELADDLAALARRPPGLDARLLRARDGRGRDRARRAAWPSASRPTSRARRASRPRCSSGGADPERRGAGRRGERRGRRAQGRNYRAWRSPTPSCSSRPSRRT